MIDSDYLVGTYDNSITNAAVVSVLLEEGLELPKNLVGVFMGDEDIPYKEAGMDETTKYHKKKVQYFSFCFPAWKQSC